MKKLLLALMISLASNPLFAQSDSDGFQKIFDGKSLSGWSGDSKYWSVEDGALTGVTDGSLKMNRFITWKASTISNFEIRVKVKVTAAGNSGIQYRGILRPDIGPDIVSGYQCDVLVKNPNYNGMLYEERGRKILSRTGEKVIIDRQGQPWVVAQMPVKEFAPDQWHDYRVLVKGNHYQHWINGHKTADLIDLDEAGRSLKGVLAVQVHVGPAMKIQFKDFYLKQLPENLPLLQAKDHPIPATAYGVRPQGKLPKDWQAPIYGYRNNVPFSKILFDDKDKWEPIAEGYEHTDAACVDEQGNFYFSDVKGGDSVYKVSPEGEISAYATGVERISGMQFGPKGILYACQGGDFKRIVKIDKAGKLTVLAEGIMPNDLVVTHAGWVYVTETSKQKIVAISPEGKVKRFETNAERPNGISLSTDQSVLLVSDHRGEKAYSYQIAKNGDLTYERPHMSLKAAAPLAASRGDGMATDAYGRYYVTSDVGIQVFATNGLSLGLISNPLGKPLNSIVFACSDFKYMYICAKDSIYRRKTKSTGLCFFKAPFIKKVP
ncbi:DUF1080 domain-containing protein [Lentisphaera marina]|uniref:family 16 glycoside hydrolase n=1 Tax=Lentisphaera marina TaxID=1111041 RepID=UPI0023654298|nr:family 16 glycoside hydrolase [Lentisphaera marina]MDD7985044.1 DUF1080 domain-containing protein [Lentisphaera marina]